MIWSADITPSSRWIYTHTLLELEYETIKNVKVFQLRLCSDTVMSRFSAGLIYKAQFKKVGTL